MENQIGKICKICQLDKPLIEFHWVKASSSYHTYCKICLHAYNKKSSSKSRLTVEPPKTQVCSRCGVTKEVKDFVKDLSTRTGIRSLCKKCKSSSPAAKIKARLHRAEKICKKNDLPFDLDFKFVSDNLKRKSCPVCGRHCAAKDLHIDRVYPDLGYTQKNCRTICAACNVSKGNKGPSEFLAIREFILAAEPKKVECVQSDRSHRRRFSYKKAISRTMGVAFDLTPEWIAGATMSGSCDLCLIATNPRNLQLDRVIPKLGYVKTNIATLCESCNLMKSDLTLTQIENFLNYIADSK